jgi:hypothetical protein
METGTAIGKRYNVLAWGEWNEATFRKIEYLEVPVFVYADGTFDFPEMVDEIKDIEDVPQH